MKPEIWGLQLKNMILKTYDSHGNFQSLSPARISQKKNNFNETNFERGRNRKMPIRKSQQSQSAPDNGKSRGVFKLMLARQRSKPIKSMRRFFEPIRGRTRSMGLKTHFSGTACGKSRMQIALTFI